MKKRKDQKWKTIIAVVLVLAIVAAIAGLFFKGYQTACKKYEKNIAELKEEIEDLKDPLKTQEKATREVDIAVVKTKIEDIGELATIEYMYTDAGEFKDPLKFFKMDVPFTTKSFLTKWDGTIKAGVKIEEIKVEKNDDKKELVVTMPKAEILSHDIDDESFETYNEKDGLFNPIKIDDIRDFDAATKEAMEQRAIENGLLDKAYANAKEIIYQLIYTEVVEENGYKIRFVKMKEK